jgi:hypothetical protein
MDQQPLFDIDSPPVRVPKRRLPAGKPRWIKYRPVNMVKCDDCMLLLALAKGNGPASQPAKWRRVTTDSDLLLCYGHAQERRRDDKLPPLKVKK